MDQRNWRLSDEPLDPENQTEELDEEIRRTTRCSIFLGYTSNLVSSGLREIIKFLVQHSYIDCLVTTAGGIEEDLIKCLGPTFVTPGGEFNIDGAGLRKRGLNRIGNLLVPNDNYCKFEDWVVPILDAMVGEQEGESRTKWSPSTVIARLGKEIDNEDSILYWAQKVRPSLPSLLAYLIIYAEWDPRLLSRVDGRIIGGHDVLSHLQIRSRSERRYRSRH